MNEHVKVYTRECADRRKWFLSRRVFWAGFVVIAGIGIGVYFFALNVLGLKGDLPVLLQTVVMGVPYFWHVWNEDRFQSLMIERFRKEENLSQVKYKIKLEFDEVGGRLVFNVVERSRAEQERLLQSRFRR